jgi:uncharacterized membrane protein (DUF441 family)
VLSEPFFLLSLVLLAGIGGQNGTIAAAALSLLVFHLLGLQEALHLAARYAMGTGFYLIILALLTPLAAGEVTISRLLPALARPEGLAAAFLMALSTVLARRGIEMLEARPEMIFALTAGAVLGTTLFGGLPTGPLIAAGLAGLLSLARR